ncbi:MAG: hypothetical protein M3Q56_01880 [Bacteroidota bacterium]|nr:hypothetical protein [Bacteroidota bacterium]
MDKERTVTPNIDVIGITDLVGGLGEDLKNILNLQYFQGFTQTEVSEELGIPLGTVKTKTRTALLNLRKLMNE